MRIAVPRERAPGEARVAMTPDGVKRLSSDAVLLRVESGAGEAAGFTDEEYASAGAEMVSEQDALYESADVVLRVNRPGTEQSEDGEGSPEGSEVDALPAGSVLIAQLRPHESGDLLERLAAGGVTALSLELVPRITRAQRMDALSAMSTVSGYSSVLIGASASGKFFPMLTTAAGTIRPSRVLVLGAGVAGLQAIATARRLGAIVEAFDIRPAVKEQVQSLGAAFVEWDEEEAGAAASGEAASGERTEGEESAEAVETAQGYAKEQAAEKQERDRRLIARHVESADVVITTALIPGRPAPKLITEEMVRSMHLGAVIVDLAAESGGNCELTRPGEVVEVHGVSIHGPLNLASSLPFHASKMYARVLTNLLGHLMSEGELRIDLEDEITGACCVTHEGKVRFQP